MAAFGPQGFLPNPVSDERATTSYGYPFPLSSALERVPDRPATAPVTLSQIMPPKRELPFPKDPPNPDTQQDLDEAGHDKVNSGKQTRKTTKTAKNSTTGKARGQTSRPSSSRAKPRPASRKRGAGVVPSLRAPDQEPGPEHSVTPETRVADNFPRKQTDTGEVMSGAGNGKSKAEMVRASSSKAKPGPTSRQEVVKEQERPPASTRQLRSQDRGHADTLAADNHPPIEQPTSVPNTGSGPSRKRKPAKEKLQPLPPESEPELEEQTVSDASVASSPAKKATAKRAMAEASLSKTNTRKKSSAVAEKPPSIHEQFTEDFENVPPEEYMDRLEHWVRKYQDLPTPKPTIKPSTDKEQLAAYVAQPEKERLAALDSMICGYLDDENFVQLVEDMDKSWRRIGLGF
ncbi:MAG: hypothetical protein LQ346_001987 [Caloplaca aetnensis]|nr:MAG: hypothetical protein LQ346_001987 [Caloplaca aetnensis]